MNNKEKYEGMMVVLNAPGGGRSLGEFFVNEVIDDNVLYGHVPNTEFFTAYYLSDGIGVRVIEERDPV